MNGGVVHVVDVGHRVFSFVRTGARVESDHNDPSSTFKNRRRFLVYHCHIGSNSRRRGLRTDNTGN